MKTPSALLFIAALSLGRWTLPVSLARAESAPDGLWRAPVYVGGRDGYHTYRIPSLVVTSSGALLAFCEGRKDSPEDNGDIDILVKRSEDGGRVWSATRIVWDENGNKCGNPTAVVDRDTGRVWLFMCHSLAAASRSSIRDGESVGTPTVWVTHSDDDGLTWSPPCEVTRQVQPPGARWDLVGPGAGIQLRHGPSAGRLVIPALGRDIVSDDHGQTWRISGLTPGKTSEAQVAELADGRLLRAARPVENKERHRVPLTLSADQGATWSPLRYAEELITPVCQGSLIRHSSAGESERGVLLFSHPGSEKKRVRLTIHASDDGGETWPGAWVLHPGPAAYSCLASLDGGEVGCLFECGEAIPRERIDLARFRLPKMAAP